MIRVELENSCHNRRLVVAAVSSSPVAVPSVGVAVIVASDPEASRLVYSMVIGLALIGVALILLAVWILRQTRSDLEVLAPLERMGDGDWKKRDPSTQRRMLDEVRPDGAQPLAREPMQPTIDAEFEQNGHPVASFADLGPGVVEELDDPTPLGVRDDLDLDLDAALGADDDDETVTDDVAVADDDVAVADDDLAVADDEALSDPHG